MKVGAAVDGATGPDARDLRVTLVGSAFYSVMKAGCYFPHLALKLVQKATTTHEGLPGFLLLASSARTCMLCIFMFNSRNVM